MRTTVNGSITGALSTVQTSSIDAALTSNSVGKLFIDSSEVGGLIIGAKSDDIVIGDFFSLTKTYSSSTIGDIIVINSNIKSNVIGAYNNVDILFSYGSIDMEGTISFEGKNEVSGNIIGSYANNLTSVRAFNAKGSVTIKDDFSIDNSSEIWGAQADFSSLSSYTKYDVFGGNTLTMASTPFTISKMGNFEYYNFSINTYNESVINSADSALITVTNELSNSNTINSKGTQINKSQVKLDGISSNLDINNGDTINLITLNEAKVMQGSDVVTLGDLFDLDFTNTIDVEKVNVGLVKTVDVSYSASDTSIVATVKSDITIDEDKLNHNVKPLAEGRLLALENITRNVDSVADVMTSLNMIGTFSPIAMIDGGKMRYNSGSHIDSNDYHLLLGTQYQTTDNLSVGMIAEYGHSHFNTYNSFVSGDVHGKGNAYNYGVSIFGHYSLPIDNDTFYLHTSLGIGSSRTKFHSDDIVTGSGTIASYNSHSNYITGSLGTGYIYTLNDTYALDSSVRYLYTRLSSDSVNIDGDQIDFDAGISSRVQLKEKLNYQLTDQLKAMLAASYEYEFDGRSGASAYGISVNSPSLKGSTWIAELGLQMQPIEDNSNFSIDVLLKCYTGKRDGVNGTVVFRYDL